MGADDNVLARTLAEVMTKNPICVSEDALAVEALKVFNERNSDIDVRLKDDRSLPDLTVREKRGYYAPVR
jgi:CBS domain-containing protein